MRNSLSRRFALRAGIPALVIAGLVATTIKAQQAGCNSGTPNCPRGVVVPCSASGCIAWSSSNVPGGAPQCAFGIGPGDPNILASYVKITVTATSWKTCEHDNSDSASCTNSPDACATYEIYGPGDDDCINPCPFGFTYTYCKAGLNNCELGGT